jgi:serine O-acetyltransferase
MSPERLWLLSIALRERGHRRLAVWVKRINALLYNNSLPPGATVGRDVRFEHRGFGTIIHDRVVIGSRVTISHHVTLAVRDKPGVQANIVLEDDVDVGPSAVVITARGESVVIGKGARVAAGAVVTEDVPPGATVLSAPSRVLTEKAPIRLARLDRAREAAGTRAGESNRREPSPEGQGDDRVDA